MVQSSHQITNFACKKNLKLNKGQGIYCIFAHMLLQHFIHMQKVLRINYDMILACLMDWILNPLNTLILHLVIVWTTSFSCKL
jgi:hypothetical protein